MSTREKKLVAAATLAAVAVVLLTAWFVAQLKRDLELPQPSKLILDRRGEYLGEVPGTGGRLGFWPVPYNLPERIVQATLETEDRYFFQHAGVHWPSLVRAATQYLQHHRVISGGSTIAMQVARMQSPGSRHLLRKLKEALEGWLLIGDHGHDRVLRHYLTIAPYGNRVHGIVRAARFYFDKPVEDLSWLQAAFLAGLPQAPGKMDPYKPEGLRRGLRRARRILGMLHQRGILSGPDLSQALHSDLGLVPKPHRPGEAMHAVLRLSELAAGRQGPIVVSTIDLDLLSRVAGLLSDNLRRLHGQGAGNTAALVVDRQSNEVLVYIGSGNYFGAEDHGAIDFVRTKRSPGSALKPFIYALGLEAGLYTAASELPDIRVEYESTDGKIYLPRNITHTFLGPLLLREALANSRNIPVLRVLSAVGIEAALEFFDHGGVSGISFEPSRYGLALALGSLHVTLEELVTLYSMLAHDGERFPLRYFQDEEPAVPVRLLPREVAQLITHILADPEARAPTFPRGSILQYNYAVAVKTGTSQGYRDGWAVAFSDRLLVGVWVGNHDWRRMNTLGGLNAAAGVAHRILDSLTPGYQAHRPVSEAFPAPEGYQARVICSLSGELAGPDCPHHRVEYFAPGTAPYQACRYHRKVPIDRRNNLRANPGCDPKFVVERVMLDLPEAYEPWARHQHLEVAPKAESPLCGRFDEGPPRLSISEPKDQARYLFDPDTPPEYATVRLSARVSPRAEDIVWLVDGTPVARVGYPHEYRLPLFPGTHTIEAALAHQAVRSRPVVIYVKD